ncbi:MAG: hypothetical protein NTZ73_01745 [Candidatus Diapherotrites archaeon]|nr:hypothetical protein [Candidatus Diapherotrites archaeon]
MKKIFRTPFFNGRKKRIERAVERARALRARKRVPWKRGISELHEMNESHARELIARKIVLPAARKALGRHLKAVLIFGSAQQGVRESVLGHRKYLNERPALAIPKKSDLDILLISTKAPDRESYQTMAGLSSMVPIDLENTLGGQMGAGGFIRRKTKKIEKTVSDLKILNLGFYVHFEIVHPDVFANEMRNIFSPFQVISGKKYVQQILEEKFFERLPRMKKELKKDYPLKYS